MSRKNITRALVLVCALVSSGCYTTKIKNANQPAPPTAEYDYKWHHGVVIGIAELSGPYTLEKICPNGWAEIETETSFVNGFVEFVTIGLYNPQSVTVRCNAGPAPAADARRVPPPPPSEATPPVPQAPPEAAPPPEEPAWQ